MTLFEAFAYYAVRLVEFTIVAAAGIAIGIKIRKNKNKKEQTVESES